jgi:hypothetical protein
MPPAPRKFARHKPLFPDTDFKNFQVLFPCKHLEETVTPKVAKLLLIRPSEIGGKPSRFRAIE